MITFDRAIEILKPETTHYSPEEYEEALRLARMALRMMRKRRPEDRDAEEVGDV